jgi:hypothetical protein
MRFISKINLLNCIVYLARKERWHVIKIRVLLMTLLLVWKVWEDQIRKKVLTWPS